MGSKLILWDYGTLSQTSTPISIGEQLLIKKDQVSDLIADTFDTESGSYSTNIPSCKCGSMSGEFYIGSVCKECNTKVRDVFVHELRYKSHIHIPEPLPPVLLPATYNVLCNVFSKALMNKVLDPTKPLAAKYQGKISQGFEAFHRNFRQTIDMLFTLKGSVNKNAVDALNQFLDNNEGCHWVRNLPIMDSSLHSLSVEGGKNMYDDNIPSIMKTIWTLSEVQYAVTTRKVYDDLYVDTNMFVAYASYMEYVDNILRDQLFGKEGVFRKHVLGARCHFSYRGCIAPISGPHKADHIRLPWRIALSLYEFEIYNLLINRYNMNLDKAHETYRNAVVGFDPIVSEIFDILIEECPYGGLPVLLGRNPSIRPGAIQLVFAEIKKDYKNKSVDISPIIAPAPNADFDGDALWGVSIKEMDMVEKLKNLHPMATMLGFGEPVVGDMVRLTAEENVAFYAWLNDGIVEN